LGFPTNNLYMFLFSPIRATYQDVYTGRNLEIWKKFDTSSISNSIIEVEH
jgi:hypothetical protein